MKFNGNQMYLEYSFEWESDVTGTRIRCRFNRNQVGVGGTGIEDVGG